MSGTKTLFSGFFALLCAFSSFAAEGQKLVLPPCFGSNMVLQRGRDIPVRGVAVPDAEVEVAIGESSAKAVAGKDGNWKVTIPSQKAGGPLKVIVKSGDETVALENVMIGDVWLCAGQSNMNYSMGSLPHAEGKLKKANHPNIRLFKMSYRVVREPDNSFSPKQNGWSVCSPESAKWFSAVAYYFAENLGKKVDVPLGIVQSGKAGSFIDGWIPKSDIASDLELSVITRRWDWIEKNFDQLKRQQDEKQRLWKAKHGRRFDMWKKARVQGPFEPHSPWGPAGVNGPLYPGNLYNGMIHPLTGMPIKGVVWYQGESNSDRAYQYRFLLRKMVRSWRKAWGQDMPFIIAQLPNYEADFNPYDYQDGGYWEVLRESQEKVLAEPGTAVVANLGLGLRSDVHPPNKSAVGERLALAAERLVYGIDVVGYYPMPESFKAEDGGMTVKFKNVGEGLVAVDGVKVRGFELAGEDKVFYPARAEVVGKDTVRVTCEKVSSPVAVRHAWDDDPRHNLFNSAGFPASTFRSDTWEVPTQKLTEPYWWLKLNE